MLISVYSFGFKFSGIPKNSFGDKGGFVFDCRFLPNPYKVKELRDYNGTDKKLENFFTSKPEFDKFIDDCILMIEPAVKNYISRDFDNMQISFGCTGGIHRSVYCSELFVKKMKLKGYELVINHVELR